MPNSRQPPPPDAGVEMRTFGLSWDEPIDRPLFPPRNRGWHQLIHVSRGAIAVRAAGREWLAIPQHAVWIPAGLDFSVRYTRGAVALRSLYVRTARGYHGPSRDCVAVQVTPLLAELILRAVSLGALERGVPGERRLAAVIRDELASLREAPLALPVPGDRRAAYFASLLDFHESATRPPLDRLLRQCGASRRTLERIFRAETSLSLGRWLRRRDLLWAVARLAAGEPVAAVSDSLGYGGPSAFIAMFKRELGQPPGEYLRQSRESARSSGGGGVPRRRAPARLG